MTAIRDEFPFVVDAVEHTWITMQDGTRLSALLRLPEIARPVPALLEYLPYRKDDGTLPRDSRQHDYLCGHGMACVRVDVRGSGDSDSILYDEYLETELIDGVEVIEWIAAQPWCNGQVSMMGISWGGFNCLQIAAKRPPALAAIVSVAATADRYATDVHYKGGTVLGTDMLAWSATMLCFNGRPPPNGVVDEAGRDTWLKRLAETPVYTDHWLDHQHRDHYWKRGSVCEDFAAIECPVLTVGGFADGYTDTVFHLVQNLAVPVRGIVGPWSHNYPAVGVPGPNIGFLQEVLDWLGEHVDLPHQIEIDRRRWDHPLRIWVQRWIEPAQNYPERPGRWITEPAWPSPNITDQSWYLSDAGLGAVEPSHCIRSARNDVVVGVRQGGWWGYADSGQLPGDQRDEELAAFRFLSEPVAEPVTLVGFPTLNLRLSVDQPVAMVAVRLCDVGPDGSSLQLSRGVLNLTHREGHEHPAPLEPGDIYDVSVTLDSIAHDLEPGHRWELHISTSLWPLSWPAPYDCELTLHLGPECRLMLPIRQGRTLQDAIAGKCPPPAGRPWFEQPETADPKVTVITPASHQRTITSDPDSGRIEVMDSADEGTVRLDPSQVEMASTSIDTWLITPGQPLSARVVCERTWSRRDGPSFTEIATHSEMWCDAEQFFTTATITAFDGGVEVFSSTRTNSHRRDLV